MMFSSKSSSQFTVVVLVTICCSKVCATTSAYITPTAYNASLHQDSAVQFTCTVQGVSNDEPLWFVGIHATNIQQVLDRGITVSPVQQPSPGTYMSTLTIPPTSENNNTEIRCLAQNMPAGAWSNLALFRVQGLLTAPRNVHLQSYNSSHHEVVWEPPITLDVTDQPDILVHTVCITLLESTVCDNVSDSSYLILKLRISATITISSWNAVGEGESTAMELESCNSEYRGTVKLLLHFEHDKPHVSIQVLTNSTSCFTAYQFEISSQIDTVYSSSGPIIPTVLQANDESMTTLSLEDLYDLNTNAHFIAYVSAVNTVENTAINFTTHDVQNVEFTPSDGSVGINCSFAEGSTAQGCHVILISDTVTATANATKICLNSIMQECLSAFTEINLAPELYSASVFDLEYNNTFDHSNVAFMATVDVPSEQIITTTSTTATISSTVLASDSINESAVTVVLATAIINTTLAQPNKNIVIIIGVCTSAGVLSMLIIALIFGITCKKCYQKFKQAPAEVVYEEPMAALAAVNLEACVAYKHIQPRAKQPHTEAIYDEPVLPPEKYLET